MTDLPPVPPPRNRPRQTGGCPEVVYSEASRVGAGARTASNQALIFGELICRNNRPLGNHVASVRHVLIRCLVRILFFIPSYHHPERNPPTSSPRLNPSSARRPPPCRQVLQQGELYHLYSCSATNCRPASGWPNPRLHTMTGTVTTGPRLPITTTARYHQRPFSLSCLSSWLSSL